MGATSRAGTENYTTDATSGAGTEKI